MEKLDISVGVISWKSPKTIVNTLQSYKKNGLLDIVAETRILFQEVNDYDRKVGEYFKLQTLCFPNNIGIGGAFSFLADTTGSPYILLLENDWVLVEEADTIFSELQAGVHLLKSGKADMIKYRHRKLPGDPLWTLQYKSDEMRSPKHLFDCVHWYDEPDKVYPDIIKKEGETGFYVCQSKWANHTNNPALFKTEFYLEKISPFSGSGVDLEGKIDGWWQEQDFKVAHKNGLFTHYRLDR